MSLLYETDYYGSKKFPFLSCKVCLWLYLKYENSSGKVKSSYELRVQIYDLRVQIHELRAPIHDLLVQIHELED